jgi:hypothetical protein
MGTGTINSLMRYKKSLETKHRELDKKIIQAHNEHTEDDKLKSMKIHKLELKQKITEVDRELETR